MNTVHALANSPQHASYADDEISLVDLWLVLTRHKRLLAAVVIGALTVGIFAAFSRPAVYQYKTTLQIGTTVQETGSGISTASIDDPGTVLAKLQEGFIPLVLNRYANDNPRAPVPALSATIPKGSELVVISGKGPDNQNEIFENLLAAVTSMLVQDHKRLMDASRNRLQSQLVREELKLEELTDPNTVRALQQELQETLLTKQLQLESLRDPKVQAVPRQTLEIELKRHESELKEIRERVPLIDAEAEGLRTTERLLKAEVGQLEAAIPQSRLSSQQARSDIAGPREAMALLVLDSELQRLRTRLAELRERLYVALPAQRAELAAEKSRLAESLKVKENELTTARARIALLDVDNLREERKLSAEIAHLRLQLAKTAADHERRVLEQRQEIVDLENRLTSLKATQALTKPLRSQRPAGPGKRVIIALAGVMGLMLGMFAAFAAEFHARVRATQNQERATAGRPLSEAFPREAGGGTVAHR